AEGDRVVLELEALGLAEGVTIDDLAEEQANGVLISVDEDTSLLLVGQTLASLEERDFFFV
ncbi:MAG: hypothetical protein AAF245_11790, partial [Pseudomonadota bacterium]